MLGINEKQCKIFADLKIVGMNLTELDDFLNKLPPPEKTPKIPSNPQHLLLDFKRALNNDEK